MTNATLTPTTPAARKAVATTIPVDRIDRDPDQPRKLFNEADLDALAASMAQLGQLQPISVRYVPSTRRYTLIMGERRWRAARRTADPHWRAANRIEAPPVDKLHALVLHGLTDAEILPRAVAENLGRADMTPMEEGHAFRRLVAAGHSVEQVAAMSGKSREYVGYRIDLLDLIGPAQEALNRGHLLVGTAWYVAKLTAAAQQRFLRKLVRGEFATARDAEAFAQACRNAETNQQGGFFAVEEMTEERREQIETRRRQVTSKVDRLAAAGQILQDLATTDPAELALLLAGLPGGVGGYRLRVDHLRDMASKAASTLRRATALAAAAGPDSASDGTIF